MGNTTYLANFDPDIATPQVLVDLGSPILLPGEGHVYAIAMVLSLVLFAMIGFSSMVGSQPGSHDWLWIGKGQFSDSHLSTDLGHALP